VFLLLELLALNAVVLFDVHAERRKLFHVHLVESKTESGLLRHEIQRVDAIQKWLVRDHGQFVPVLVALFAPFDPDQRAVLIADADGEVASLRIAKLFARN
jgi:hypothetical protein